MASRRGYSGYASSNNFNIFALTLIFEDLKCVKVPPEFPLVSSLFLIPDIPGAAAAVSTLLEQNKQLIFVSNNCGKTVEQLQNKFQKLLNIHNIPSKNIITSAVSTAIYLKNRMNVETEKVYMIAQPAFATTLKEFGIESFGLGSPKNRAMTDWAHFVPDKSVKYVIASYDPDFCYNKITEAYIYITENNAEFISSDVDQHFSLGSRKVPGSLSIQAAISAAVAKQPIITGKPDPFMLSLIQEEHGKFDLERTIMIGDTYGTDVMFGKNCGIGTAVVLTGNSKEGDVDGWKDRPDFVLKSIEGVLD